MGTDLLGAVSRSWRICPRHCFPGPVHAEAKVETSGNVTVRETLPALLRRSPYLAARTIGGWTVSQAYAAALDSMDPNDSIARFWPSRALSFILKARLAEFSLYVR